MKKYVVDSTSSQKAKHRSQQKL